jgi:hypothetical protein
VFAAAPGSFRDPTNRVFTEDDRVLRVLSASGLEDFQALGRSQLFEREVTAGRLVRSELVTPVPEGLAAQGWTAALEHERVPVVSYPYEWSFEMLKDAALLELDLTLAALGEGLITKDATPFNVQFVGTRPVHIDIGSFEPLVAGEPWFGYGQFCMQLLHPLILSARRGLAHHAMMRGSLKGVSASDCVASLRWTDLLRPSVLLLVGVPAYAERRRRSPGRDVREELAAAGFGPKVIEAQLRRLRKAVSRLTWDVSSSAWSDYSQRGHYTDENLEAKARFVERVAAQRHRSQVLDLGANDGYFSELVLPSADYVVAVDRDPLVIDGLYRRLRERPTARVLPLVVDLADPSGGLGWRSRERLGFSARMRPDLLLCLAFIHHLFISESIPFEEVVALLADWSAETVVELPTPEDEMAQLLMGRKKDRRLAEARYHVDGFESAVAARFEIVERLRIGTRLLYHLRPRHASAPSRPVDGHRAP